MDWTQGKHTTPEKGARGRTEFGPSLESNTRVLLAKEGQWKIDFPA